jgi:hypothetical protein
MTFQKAGPFYKQSKVDSLIKTDKLSVRVVIVIVRYYNTLSLDGQSQLGPV